MKKIISFLASAVLLSNLAFAEMYKVPVELRNAYEVEKKSMANAALKEEAKVVVNDNKSTITIYLKAIEIGTATENVNKVFVVENDNKVEGKKTLLNQKPYDVQVDLVSSSKKPSDVKLAFWVNAMDALQGGKEGSGEQLAILKLDWAKAKEIKEETKVPAKTNTAGESIKVFVNGQEVNFDAKPVKKDGRVLVPLRAIFEALDAKVTWDGKTQSANATKGDNQIKLVLNNKNAEVKNGDSSKNVVLDVPAKLENGRIYVPLRFIGEAFGNKVLFEKDGASATIKIS